MNRIILLLAGILLVITSCTRQSEQSSKNPVDEPVDLVNPLMGTDSEFKLSNGNTYPAIALPWGMNFWTPQTGEMGNGWAYTYDAYKIRGIKQTHQPSPWVNDYGAFSLMAVTGELKVDEDSRASWFSHKAEVAKPNYYSVYLADYDTQVEVTPTERSAIFRFTFPETDSAFILLDGFFEGSSVTISPDKQTITGYARNNSGGVPENFHNYFVARFDKPFKYQGTWSEGEYVPGKLNAESEHSGAVVGFNTEKGETVRVKVASSFISPEQAVLNLERETASKDFEQVRAEGRKTWNDELNRIKVYGGSADEQETFYSCLYRVLLFPRKFYEFNEQEDMVHYSPYNGEVKSGYMFTDNGFWDTFRAVFPFFTLMYPELNSNIMKGLVNTYKESGWLPEWASPGHRNVMIGSNSASIIADSYLKGIRGYDIETLYEAMVKNTKGHGPVESVGRYGAEYYNELGYVPYDVGINENAARTLEYAYADYTIMQLAEELDKPEEEIEKFAERAQNYRNLFDPETNLMRGKNQDGTFQSPFNPFKWGDAFTEGNSWHYTWSVFHDVQGLADLMGGREAFTKMLDSVFALPPKFDASYYGFPIHEIREMQIVNMGQYAHGNQPIQHMPYLYNYAGQPWKSQYWVREIMDKLYSPEPDGYCGDEDNGQTSAWYVFSSMGFYPVCPGQQNYALGSPLFDRIEVEMPTGNTLTITNTDNAPENVYIQNVELDRNALEQNYIRHQTLQDGGELTFEMGPEPNKQRGTDLESFPPSMSMER